MTELAAHQLRQLINNIFDAHPDGNMDCERCGQHLCHLAELVAAGAALCELIPAVEAHLSCCPDCKEEWDALLVIVQADRRGYVDTQLQSS